MIYEHIAGYIKANKINQSHIAREADMTRQAMSDSMRGVRRLTADEYFRICDALGVPLDFFKSQPGRKAS